MTGGSAGPHEAGFTLAELLVALALLALMSMALLSALQSSRHMARLTDRLEQDSSLDNVVTHLRRTIEAVRVVFHTRREGAPTLAFAGAPEALELATVADGRLEMGGLYLVRYGLGREGEFVTDRRLYRPDLAGSEDQDGDTVTLLEGVTSLEFRYFGSPAPDAEPEWLDRWLRADALPRAIEVRVEFAAGDRRTWAPLKVLVPAAN